MKNRQIDWADYTFNPWQYRVDENSGAKRDRSKKNGEQPDPARGVRPNDNNCVTAADRQWKLPPKWNRDAKAKNERHRVICASLVDIFEDRPDLDEPRQRLFSLIDQCDGLDWLLLTMQPENVLPLLRRCAATVSRIGKAGVRFAERWLDARPPDQVWLGVSVKDQSQANERIPMLLEVPAAARFLCVEPMHGKVDIGHWLGDVYECEPDSQEFRCGRDIDWVVCGGGSGPGAVALDLAWPRSLRDQCKAAGTAFFLNQMGSNPETWQPLCEYPSQGWVMPLKLIDRDGRGPAEWPRDLQPCREFPTQLRACSPMHPANSPTQIQFASADS
jgi:protein gp37